MKVITFVVDRPKCKEKRILVIYSNFKDVRFSSCTSCKNSSGEINSFCKFADSGIRLFVGETNYGNLLLGTEEEI